MQGLVGDLRFEAMAMSAYLQRLCICKIGAEFRKPYLAWSYTMAGAEERKAQVWKSVCSLVGHKKCSRLPVSI